jgi:EAL domain-containing protein (putative c-di-GMP-specific phosphodiesterase class I)
MTTFGQPLWFLEGFAQADDRLWRVPLRSFPFRVGRHPGLELTLPSNSVSGRHAQLRVEAGRLQLQDLGSTNGTFVNRRRIEGETTLEIGDVVHFAAMEFRVGLENNPGGALGNNTTQILQDDLPERIPQGARQFYDLLEQHRVTPYFQPIVHLPTNRRVGYEILGRGTLPTLPKGPAELFRLAVSMGLESELSQVFRQAGIESAAASARADLKFFVNIHPSEIHTRSLVRSMQELRAAAPQLPMVLEVHEGAVTNVLELRQLRTALLELDIQLAYDDFGAGQARLAELVEVPPDYIKFDMQLIHGVDAAPPTRQKVLSTLVQMVRNLGIAPLAEGTETAGEVEACRQLGFELAQGFFFGAPGPSIAPD